MVIHKWGPDIILDCHQPFICSAAGMPTKLKPCKLSLAGNNLIISRQGKFGYWHWHPGWGWENRLPFLQCILDGLQIIFKTVNPFLPITVL